MSGMTLEILKNVNGLTKEANLAGPGLWKRSNRTSWRWWSDYENIRCSCSDIMIPDDITENLDNKTQVDC